MSKNDSDTIQLSVIAPVYNEATGLKHFHESLVSVLKKQDLSYEVLYIDDGSTDESAKVIKQLAQDDNHVRTVNLSRNFGKEAATSAGLHVCKGQAAIIIDADGQHPVELIPEFVAWWQDGAQVVIGVRSANQKEGFIKRHGSRTFYRLLKVLGVGQVIPGSTDFRLVDRQVIESFKKLTEHNRVTRALIDWLGYDRQYIEFKANARVHGEASYSHKKLLQLALNGFVSLTFIPLYLSGYMGVAITFLSFLVGTFAVIEKYLLGDPMNLNFTGSAILAVLILFLVGILLIGQGLLAIYVARIYTEVQNRPLYIVKD